MQMGRFLLRIVLFVSLCGAMLPRSGQPSRVNCCPDGETMECCRNQSGCSLEKCDTAPALPVPAWMTVFLVPGAHPLLSPDSWQVLPSLSAGTPQRPILDQPDPPPRA